MKAVCQLCRREIFGPAVAEHARDVLPGSPAAQLIDYDALASHMWLHISEHHPAQVSEGILQQRRAAKLYAMNWATIAEDLEPVRRDHRAQLIMGLTVTTDFNGETQTAAGASSAEASADSPGDGSNVKKSVRNVSN